MKERGVIMTGPESAAAHAGSMMQFTRPIRPPPINLTQSPETGACYFIDDRGYTRELSDVCPFGKVGDRLWVREPFGVECLGGMYREGEGFSSYKLKYKDGQVRIFNHAGNVKTDVYSKFYDHQRGDWWSASNMPRWASRTLLEITDIDVRRVQDTTDDDESCGLFGGCWMYLEDNQTGAQYEIGPREAFRQYWSERYGKKTRLSYEENPWIWVVKFRKVEK